MEEILKLELGTISYSATSATFYLYYFRKNHNLSDF